MVPGLLQFYWKFNTRMLDSAGQQLCPRGASEGWKCIQECPSICPDQFSLHHFEPSTTVVEKGNLLNRWLSLCFDSSSINGGECVHARDLIVSVISINPHHGAALYHAVHWEIIIVFIVSPYWSGCWSKVIVLIVQFLSDFCSVTADPLRPASLSRSYPPTLLVMASHDSLFSV